MSAQAARRQVEDMDERVEEVEGGRCQHNATMSRSLRSGEAKSESESKKGSANIAYEMDVERTGIWDSGRKFVIP